MDDSCAVCADALEWVAYGSCGHREVCSTCVVRLRFVLDDRRCCICKTENPIVFITKAMGDYTRVITDFSMFPSGATEGKAGAYWYHEGTQAFFDDVDHYKMIKATCRLSCSVCDKSTEEQGKKTKFRSIEQLKGHLFHQHRLFMCSLCLEGRKVFICEQKLYSRSQLNQHINTGDSEVDGSESERGGFMGHPMCEFCRNPFYGDNELYTHMSTEHFTCHICQRQHPGQYDYYKNYDDLEIHFRQEHFLCEDEACLAKKFIVFLSEAEMKRHNTLEHGGHMSRSQRNAAFQIPTSFRYRRNNEQEHRRGRGRGSRAHQFGFEFRVAEPPSTDPGETSQGAPPFTSFESLAINPDAEPATPVIEESSFPPLSDREPPEPSSRYAQALHYSRNATRLGEDSFPPLPAAEKTSKPKASHGPKILGKNTLASRGHLHGKGHVATSRSAWARPSENQETGSSRPLSSQIKPTTNPGVSSSTPPISQPRIGAANQGFPSLSTPSVSHPRAEANQGFPSLSTPLISHPRVGPNQEFPSLPTPPTSQPRAGVNQGFPSPSPANGLTPPVSANSPWKSSTTNRMRHSSSAPNLIEGGSANPPTPTTVFPEVKEVQTANKSLVERIRASLGMDEDRYAAFKNISGEFRQGQINTWEYLSYVEQFGLLHLVLELARLCPDPKKQKELIDAYNANLRGVSMVSKEEEKKGKGKGKDKGKGVDLGDNNGSRRATDALTDSILDTVRKLQSNNLKPQEEVENLSKDGYRKANNAKAYADSSGSREPPPRPASSSGGSKQKKTAKFQRVRLGDGSAAALLDPGLSIGSLERDSNSDIEEGVIPVRGVWRNGGGMRLVANSQKSSSK